MTAVIQEESTTLSNEEDGLYELTLNEDGTVARITTRNSNGSNVASVVVGVLAIAKIVEPFCCSAEQVKPKTLR